MEGLQTTLYIIGIIAGILAIIALFYITLSSRRKAITLRKVDYLVEDVTHKSELLTSSVETVAKIANYIDIFETVAKKNMKSAAKLISRNKDDIYKIVDRIKKLAVGEDEFEKNQTKPKSKTKPKGGK